METLKIINKEIELLSKHDAITTTSWTKLRNVISIQKKVRIINYHYQNYNRLTSILDVMDKDDPAMKQLLVSVKKQTDKLQKLFGIDTPLEEYIKDVNDTNKKLKKLKSVLSYALSYYEENETFVNRLRVDIANTENYLNNLTSCIKL